MIDSQLMQKLAGLKEEETLNLVRKELAEGTAPTAILEGLFTWHLFPSFEK